MSTLNTEDTAQHGIQGENRPHPQPGQGQGYHMRPPQSLLGKEALGVGLEGFSFSPTHRAALGGDVITATGE